MLVVGYIVSTFLFGPAPAVRKWTTGLDHTRTKTVVSVSLQGHWSFEPWYSFPPPHTLGLTFPPPHHTELRHLFLQRRNWSCHLQKVQILSNPLPGQPLGQAPSLPQNALQQLGTNSCQPLLNLMTLPGSQGNEKNVLFNSQTNCVWGGEGC